MKPARSTSARLLKRCEELTDSERHDLAEVLSHWARSEEHANRIVLGLPSRPTALDIRRAALHSRPAVATKRARQGCSHCFGSGFSVTIRPDGYTAAKPCDCVVEQPELMLTGRR